MVRSTYAIAIGALSCMFYLVLTGKVISKLVYYAKHPRPWYYHDMPIYISSLIGCVAMCVISVLLIMGVRKKRHRLIGPWVIVGALEVVGGILMFFISGVEQPANAVLLYIVYIALFILIWYPIYNMWRDMRNQTNSEQRQGGNAPPDFAILGQKVQTA